MGRRRLSPAPAPITRASQEHKSTRSQEPRFCSLHQSCSSLAKPAGGQTALCKMGPTCIVRPKNRTVEPQGSTVRSPICQETVVIKWAFGKLGPGHLGPATVRGPIFQKPIRHLIITLPLPGLFCGCFSSNSFFASDKANVQLDFPRTSLPPTASQGGPA